MHSVNAGAKKSENWNRKQKDSVVLSMDENEIQTLANEVGKYIMKNLVEPRLSKTVSFYRAFVTAAASNGKITVQKPFDTSVALPYVTSAAGLNVGDQCTVLVLGDYSNSIIIGDGKLTNL